MFWNDNNWIAVVDFLFFKNNYRQQTKKGVLAIVLHARAEYGGRNTSWKKPKIGGGLR